jgi:hypothetical protein
MKENIKNHSLERQIEEKKCKNHISLRVSTTRKHMANAIIFSTPKYGKENPSFKDTSHHQVD